MHVCPRSAARSDSEPMSGSRQSAFGDGILARVRGGRDPPTIGIRRRMFEEWPQAKG